jgi:hypothetical protein
MHACWWGEGGCYSYSTLDLTPPWRWFNTVLTKKNTVLAKFTTILTKKNTVLAKFNTVLAKFNTVLTKKNTAEFSVIFSYSIDSSLGRVPACHTGGPGSIPGRCSSVFGIWREVLGRYLYIISQYWDLMYTLRSFPSTFLTV